MNETDVINEHVQPIIIQSTEQVGSSGKISELLNFGWGTAVLNEASRGSSSRLQINAGQQVRTQNCHWGSGADSRLYI